MSTRYGIVGYPDAPRAQGADVLSQAEEALRDAGMIAGGADPEAAYAAVMYAAPGRTHLQGWIKV